jgi:hypothetical protein
MELAYDYKNVDWKEVKKQWDAHPDIFNLDISHRDKKVAFQSFINKQKTIKIWLFIDGRYKGEYRDKEHEYRKYHNFKEQLPFNKKYFEAERKFDKKLRKLTDRQIVEKLGMKMFQYWTPVFDNIAQIKKMVSALE